VRRAVFLEMGGFDDFYRRPCIEDIEFGVRLRKHGHRILLHKDIQVTHLKRWTLWGMLKADIRDRAMPWSQLILREKTMPNDLNLRLSHRFSAVLALVLLLTMLAGAWQVAAVLAAPVLFLAVVAAIDRWSLTRRVPTAVRGLGVLAMCGCTLAVAYYFQGLILIPILVVVGIVLLNWRFYVFLARTRHLLFAVIAVPLQILHYVYSSVTFALAVCQHTLGLGGQSSKNTSGQRAQSVSPRGIAPFKSLGATLADHRNAPLTEAPPTVAVVVPVLNEAHVLEKSIGMLLDFLRERFPYPAHVIIADNGSTDATREIARKLSNTHADVRLICLPIRGRGRALRAAWTQSSADIVCYMDVDLSTELEALEKLCRAIHEHGYEIATGSRLMRESRITRCLKREILSRGYNLFIKCVLRTRFSDAQCGFKAVSRRVVDEVVPLIENEHWFFDTELLVLGEKLGYRIKDVPVQWIEDSDSRVKIVSTVWEDIKGVFRLRWLFWSRRWRGGVREARRPAPVLAVSSAEVRMTYAPLSE
jgi:GT2 family glycosyltransferase